jgi:uncharacterized protein
MITKTPKTTPSRLAKRATYDEETIHSILDESLFCTISYSLNGQPMSIPTAFFRKDDYVYIHGSVGSHFIRTLESGCPICFSVMLVDALVLAKSAFHHSVNYRSVVLFASAEKVEDEKEKAEAMFLITDKIIPERWDSLRPMTDSEVRKTTILRFKIEEVSAKLRTGEPSDDDDDKALPIWSGLIPVSIQKSKPIADNLSKDLPLPKHLERYI